MNDSTLPSVFRRQVVPWVVTSVSGVLVSFVSFIGVSTVFDGTGLLTSQFDEGLGVVASMAAAFAAMATLGQSIGLVVSYHRWRALSRWRLAAWSTVAAVATAGVAACVMQVPVTARVTVELFDEVWVGVALCAGIGFAATIAVACGLTRFEPPARQEL